ncbi:MAG: type II toxin-antitoxin system RelE/ParE family toxin [Chloroflexi bacterium]|nr:type II toxin-antitoxin system RelE/ParE family toxin [Chloroflexota bacterium]
MSYRVIITRLAEKHMRTLPEAMRRRIDRKIASLGEAPYRSGTTRVTTTGGCRARVGDYRILFDVDDSHRLVIINAVRHRREAYR